MYNHAVGRVVVRVLIQRVYFVRENFNFIDEVHLTSSKYCQSETDFDIEA